MRSIIYVDGFNLYYGALKGGPHRWLNLDRYFELLRTDDVVQRIWYITAVIEGPRRARQLTYLQALSSTTHTKALPSAWFSSRAIPTSFQRSAP